MNRPDPDELLQRAEEEARQAKRSRLKIYLGAAPGVGKTYAMLHDAMEKRANDFDVVVGIAESHGRREIEALLKSQEILPRIVIDYHGSQCREFDLDAALKRNPGLILMDEMAHTNAPELRHRKRWQDILELLDNGIDVYTTLNVQHIESLKDDVAQIIQAPVKETVPDSMIEMANTIELVDLPPEELLKRLQDGKIYVPEQAELATQHFFRKGNLIALRELALRTTAKRVSTDVLLYRQGEGIQHIWPIKDKFLVCVGPGEESLKLIRGAKRIASSLQSEWIAVFVDTPRYQTHTALRQQAIENLRLAEQLGATTHVLTGFDLVKEIIQFAHEQNVTQIIIWKHIRTRWQAWLRRNLADEILRKSGEIDVYIMTGTVHTNRYKPPQAPKPIAWKNYVISFGVVTIATALNLWLYPILTASNLVMIYLLGITIIALLGQTGPSLLASILSVAAYDYFMVSPFYQFTISDVKILLTLIVMLIFAQTISYLTIVTRRQSQSAQLVQQQTTALYTLSSQLTHTRGIHQLVETSSNYLGKVFNSHIQILLPKKNQLELVPTTTSKQKQLPSKEQAIAEWVYKTGQAAGLGTNTLTFSKALYRALKASEGSIGVLRIEPPATQQFYTPEQLRLLESCMNQIALALEVDRLQEKSRKKELKIEADRARNSLLQAIANDLHAPLKLIIHAASTLKIIKQAKIRTIGHEINDEIEKLNQLNNNILQIIQLESHELQLKKTPTAITTVINLVMESATQRLKDRPVTITIPKHLPSVPLNNDLMHGALFNLIDNAVKFSPAKSPIEISVSLKQPMMIISVIDSGPGITLEEKNKLFEKFYRGKQLVTEHGLGLGLAICQKIIIAHGGQIWVENVENKGAAFRFSLPLAEHCEGSP